MAQTTRLRFMQTEADLRFAWRLRNANREFFFNSELISWEQHTLWWLSQLKRLDFQFYIIWRNGHRAGTIAHEEKWMREAGYWLVFLQNLCIAEKYRGHGLAKWAIKELMRRNRFIIAQVKPDNKHVIRMYEELGFWRVRQ